MKRGITVTNYLINGNPEGIIFAYVSNWSGQAIKIPRNLFAEAKELNEINRPGVYFLLGQNPENPDDKMVYTGEANNLSERLVTHMRDSDKTFCETIVCFSSKDENLTVSHTKYLEQKIISHISKSSEYRAVNSKSGNTISLSAMVRDEMETFYDNMKIVLPTIGYSILQDIVVNVQKKGKDNDLLYLDTGGIKATAKLTANGIEVLTGSKLNEKLNTSLSGSYVNLRKTLIYKNIIEQKGGELQFVQNYEFSSPSAAGAVILGYPVNGRSFWKNINGKSLNDIEADALQP